LSDRDVSWRIKMSLFKTVDNIGNMVGSIGNLFNGESTWGVPIYGLAFLAIIGTICAVAGIAVGVHDAPLRVNDMLTMQIRQWTMR